MFYQEAISWHAILSSSKAGCVAPSALRDPN
jgi:hypothetical protein